MTIRTLRMFVLAMCVASIASAQEVRFRWAFGAATGVGPARHFAPISSEDVTLRSGPEHLPAEWLRRRLELFERWFPPNRPLFA